MNKIHALIVSLFMSYFMYVIFSSYVKDITFITFICLEILLIFKQVFSIFVSKNSTQN